jgi:hypothetical protein
VHLCAAVIAPVRVNRYALYLIARNTNPSPAVKIKGDGRVHGAVPLSYDLFRIIDPHSSSVKVIEDVLAQLEGTDRGMIVDKGETIVTQWSLEGEPFQAHLPQRLRIIKVTQLYEEKINARLSWYQSRLGCPCSNKTDGLSNLQMLSIDPRADSDGVTLVGGIQSRLNLGEGTPRRTDGVGLGTPQPRSGSSNADY